jgi:hypothetical protein
MDADDPLGLEHVLSTLAVREDVRVEGERLRERMTLCMERVSRTIQALIDAIELMKYIDSEVRQRGTGAAD